MADVKTLIDDALKALGVDKRYVASHREYPDENAVVFATVGGKKIRYAEGVEDGKAGIFVTHNGAEKFYEKGQGIKRLKKVGITGTIDE